MLFANNLRLQNFRNMDFNENIYESITYIEIPCTFSALNVTSRDNSVVVKSIVAGSGCQV